MKFRQTRFAKQLAAVIVGLLLVVGTVAFVTIPANLGGLPGDPLRVSTVAGEWHPT